MILEQNFLESDLVEVIEVFKKSTEYKHYILKSVPREDLILLLILPFLNF